jgi:hypothetical protein
VDMFHCSSSGRCPPHCSPQGSTLVALRVSLMPALDWTHSWPRLTRGLTPASLLQQVRLCCRDQKGGSVSWNPMHSCSCASDSRFTVWTGVAVQSMCAQEGAQGSLLSSQGSASCPGWYQDRKCLLFHFQGKRYANCSHHTAARRPAVLCALRHFHHLSRLFTSSALAPLHLLHLFTSYA